MFQTTTVPPNITQRPDPEMFDRMVGDTLSLPCVAEGFPPPDVLWTHNGSKLENCTLDRLNRREVCAEFPRGGDRGSSSVLTLSVEGSMLGCTHAWLITLLGWLCIRCLSQWKMQRVSSALSLSAMKLYKHHLIFCRSAIFH